MFLWLSLLVLGFFLSALFIGSGGVLSKLWTVSREAISPLECGFNGLQDMRMPVSLRFFIFAVIFVIFDVELVLLLPILASRKSYVDLGFLYFGYTLLLCIGLFMEWNNSAFDWVD